MSWCHTRMRTGLIHIQAHLQTPSSHHTIVFIWRKNLHRGPAKKWALWARPRFEMTNVLPYNKLDIETDTTNHWQGPENPRTRNIWGCRAPARGLNRFSLPALKEREGGSVSTCLWASKVPSCGMMHPCYLVCTSLVRTCWGANKLSPGWPTSLHLHIMAAPYFKPIRLHRWNPAGS